MPITEIVLPITEPETEWVRGRALQKVSPKRDHARIQLMFGIALERWSSGRGEVGTEWRFRIAPPGESRRPLVPDVAFVSNGQLRGLTHEDLQVPAFAPDVAVEVLSEGDDPHDVAAKIDVYLRAETALVIVIDPAGRTVSLHSRANAAIVLTAADVLCHAALPDFTLELGPFFADALDPPR